jgi:SAM-dependent methyltransferase
VTGPIALYDAALRRAARGLDAPLHLVDRGGRRVRMVDAGHYTHPRRGDEGLLDRCGGPTLDLGCGPGRLTAALAARGVPVLGVDVSPTAVRQAHRRGASALLRDVFGPLPAEGRWHHALLIDGNIGIGGDPVRLLHRCAALIGPHGDVLVETEPPGARTWRGLFALADRVRVSDVFPWAFVAAQDLAGLAAHAGLAVAGTWTEAGRCFARLT